MINFTRSTFAIFSSVYFNETSYTGSFPDKVATHKRSIPFPSSGFHPVNFRGLFDTIEPDENLNLEKVLPLRVRFNYATNAS